MKQSSPAPPSSSAHSYVLNHPSPESPMPQARRWAMSTAVTRMEKALPTNWDADEMKKFKSDVYAAKSTSAPRPAEPIA